jgi:hypothetical protein
LRRDVNFLILKINTCGQIDRALQGKTGQSA